MLTPAVLITLVAILSVSLVAVSAACGVLWRRARAWPSKAPGNPSTTVSVDLGRLGSRPVAKGRSEVNRRVDELTDRFQAMESRLAKVEASTTVGANGLRRVDRGSPATSGGPTLIAVPSLSTLSTTSTSPEVGAELDRRFGAVWAMADAGASTEDLARETGYPIGQVELILGLRRRLLAAEAGTDA